MMSGRMSAGASDDYQFPAMQQQQPPPYAGFEHAGMLSASGSDQRGDAMMYDNFDFAAAAAAFGQCQQEASPHHHHQMLALPPPSGGLMAPPPMPHGMQLQMPPMPHGMQLQMPPMPMHGGGELYPALGMVRREGGGGADAGRIGLNLDRHTYFSPGDMMAVDRLLMRSRLAFGGPHHQPPRCQAEGCKADLSGAKRYHRRHKVCEYHAKASLVAAGGKQQRFCQQCSRFHVLTEFDEAKRSCRKRLAEHNRRRRVPEASGNGTTVSSKDSGPPPSKKPNAGAVSSSYTADNNNLSAAKSAISSKTSTISCLQQQQDQGKVARPTALTLSGAPPPAKEDYQLNAMHLQAQADHHHRHQEQQHFITSLLHNNNNNILSCSSVSSSVLPANGEASDQHNNDHNDNGGGNNNNMHLFEFEMDFM